MAAKHCIEWMPDSQARGELLHKASRHTIQSLVRRGYPDWEHIMNDQDEKLRAKVKGWMYIAEGVVTVAGGVFLLFLSIITPLLPIAFTLFIFVALLGPAVWFIRVGKRSLDKANEL